MINQLQIHGLGEQPKQRNAYFHERAIVNNNWNALKKSLKKKELRRVIDIIDAKDMIGYYVAKDCYVNGFCAAMKFMLDNIYEEI